MKKLICLLFLIPFMAMAQNPTNKDIVGTYKLPNSNPEGGQSVIIFKNNTFATFYFGGALKGTWKIDGNEVKFKTTAYPKFYLYGRKLAALKDSTHLNFSCEENSFVNLSAKTKSTFQPLFNEDANCFGYPYVYKTNLHLNQIAFAKKDYRYDDDDYHIYTFEHPKTYNDLIVVGLPEEYTTESEFSAIYKDGNLYFGNSEKPASKRPASIKDSEENIDYMNEFMSKEIVPEVLTYGNEFFPNYDNPTEEELTPFTRIAPVKKEKSEIKIGINNLFTARCEER